MQPEPCPSKPVDVTVQSIIYNNAPGSVRTCLEALDNAARIGKRDGACARLAVVLGDASPSPLFDQVTVDELAASLEHVDKLTYTFFGENTGTAKGHNRLAALDDSDFLVTMNPDIVVDARALWRMATLFDEAAVGMVEAKQLPVEHPKSYEKFTGRTSWSATACAMTRRDLFDRLGGFDEATFFMYCDDVDYSWLVREAGHEVVFLPSAVVFHDKRLTGDGTWIATSAEAFFSAQAALLLAHKWSRDDEVERIAELFQRSHLDEHRKAVEEFTARRDSGRLVPQHDPDGTVAEFSDGFYAKHRYAL
jgi:GT2 family glycosyltransferase